MQNCKILIVEDNTDELELCASALKKQGYEVATATNGADALKEASHFHPQLIIMDVLLPDINGPMAVKILNKHIQTKDIAIMFMTGTITKEEEQLNMGITIGETSYAAIAKPIAYQDFLNRVNRQVAHLHLKGH